MDNTLLRILDEEVAKERSKRKKKALALNKEKRLQYYSGWHKDDKPVTESKEEKQKFLNECIDIYKRTQKNDFVDRFFFC